MRRPEARRRGQARGLRRRLIVGIFAPLLLILVASSALDYRLARRTVDLAEDRTLADSLFDLDERIGDGTVLPRALLRDESDAMRRSAAPDRIYFAIRDGSGKLLAGDAGVPDLPPLPGGQPRFVDGEFGGRAVRAVVAELPRSAARLRIVMMETTQARRQATREILEAMLGPNLAVVAATLLAVLFGVRHGLLPLRVVEREIAARSADDLREIDPGRAPAEIRPMLERLNHLFALLQRSAQAQRRFIAHAAHQLRTPLSGLQTQIDLAAGEGAFADHPERHARIDEATTRIGRLLGQLLAFARAEASASLAEGFAPVALGQLLEKSATVFLDAALAKDIDLGFEIEPATVPGLSWMLQEVLANLIDNAIRYTPRGGVITVRCGSDAGRGFLEVEDNGPGIPDDQRQRVFDSFYRIPGSPGNGGGLGLAIVAEMARLHGAQVQLLSGAGGGLRVRVDFGRSAA